MPTKQNIILFGAGSFGIKALEYYKKQLNINIIAFSDNDKAKHNTKVQNIRVISPQNIKNENYDKIIITSTFDDKIYKQLIDLNVQKNKVIICSINNITSHFGESVKLEMAHELLLYVSNLFNQADIEYHIDHGTLLGIVRNKSLLPWDKDVDFAMPSSELDSTINILKSSLKFFKSKYCNNNNWKYIFRPDENIEINNTITLSPVTIKICNDCEEELTNGFTLDIKFKYEYNNNLYWRVGVRVLASRKDLCFPSSSVVFKNTRLNTARDTVQYLESLYGNWKIPVKEWNYRQYTNIRELSSP